MNKLQLLFLTLSFSSLQCMEQGKVPLAPGNDRSPRPTARKRSKDYTSSGRSLSFTQWVDKHNGTLPDNLTSTSDDKKTPQSPATEAQFGSALSAFSVKTTPLREPSILQRAGLAIFGESHLPKSFSRRGDNESMWVEPSDSPHYDSDSNSEQKASHRQLSTRSHSTSPAQASENAY